MAIMAPDDLNSVALSLCLQIIGSAVQHPGMSNYERVSRRGPP